MTLPAFYLRSAVHNLRRGGQRVLVALLCIAFGVMSVVSMTLLSEALRRMLVVTPPELIGADITLDRMVEESIFPDHIAGLKALQDAGKIKRFTLVSYTSSLVYRRPGSGELHFPAAGMGVDQSTYPLMGTFKIYRPGTPNPTLAGSLQKPGDVLVTRDLADEENLHAGDTILLSDLTVGAVVEGRIQGIVTDTPNHQGSKIYYTQETARTLAGGAQAVNTVLVTAADPASVTKELDAQGWRTFSAVELAKSDEQVQNMFEIALKGAGILGMLVGGIGIANTMQVLLRRRRREVAVYKTIGYRQGQLQAMFALEAALLGTLGSLLGAGLGVAVSYGLVSLFTRITNLLISWTFSPLPVLNGLLVGIVTTVSFAMFAIVLASRVRPLALLRSEALDAGRIPWFQTVGLILLCGMPFAIVTALVMGSLLKGVGILLFALAGLAGLGGLLGGLVWVLTRLLPLRAWPLLHMARNNLRRRGFSPVFAMIALFVGVVSLALGVVVTTSASRALDARLIKFEGDNLTIIAPAGQEAAIQKAAESQPGIEHLWHGYQTSVRTIRAVGAPDARISPVLMGREEPGDYQVSGAPWGSAPEGVYTFQGDTIKPGSQVEVTLPDGSTHTLPVVGTYMVNFQAASPRPDLGLLMDNTLSRRLAQPETVQFYLRAPASQIDSVSAALGAALPQATVINLPAYAARFTQTYANLFIFAVAMAGLALLAGILLVANSVSLAMLDRRYEIGVLKSIGYARRQVLFTLVVEYSLVAVIACATGLLMVQGFLWVVALVNHLAGSLLMMPPEAAALIALLSIGLTLLTVLGVTWRPTQVSPVVVLNDRE